MSLKHRIGVDLGRMISAEHAIEWAGANDVSYVESQVDLSPNALASMDERA